MRPAATTLTEIAYGRIKEEIITGVLQPGRFINEREFCERLRMGRTPIHQALGQLRQERFIEVIPRRGIIIRQITMEEYHQLEETRLEIVPAASRLAAERVTAVQLAALESLYGHMVESQRAGDRKALLLHNRDFGFLVAEATHNAFYASILKSLHERSLRFWFASLAEIYLGEAVIQFSRALLDTLSRRDGEGAADLVRRAAVAARVQSASAPKRIDS